MYHNSVFLLIQNTFCNKGIQTDFTTELIMPMPMMQMYLHFRTNEIILFREWLLNNLTGFLFSLLGVLALGAAYEALRVVRALLFQLAERRDSEQQCCLMESPVQPAPSVSSGDCNCLSPQLFYNVHQWPFSSQLLFSSLHLCQSVLHFGQFFLGFSLMLVAMTYNVPIFGALIIGHSIGYFLTAPLYRHGLAEEQRVGGECCCS